MCKHDFSERFHNSIVCSKCGIDMQCVWSAEECEVERLIKELELYSIDTAYYLSCDDADKLAKWIRSHFTLTSSL